MTPSPSERAAAAERAWFLAKIRGDERLRAAALADYRTARRAERAQNRPVKIDEREARAFLAEWAP
jgi:hypothetical protein